MSNFSISTDRILQTTASEAYYELVSHALIFAVLGQLSASCRLISLLNTYAGRGTSERSLKPLWFAWTETGVWPEGERERVNENIEALAKDYAEGWYGDKGRRRWKTYTNDVDGLTALMQDLSVDAPWVDAETGSAAMDRSEGLVKALDLRLRLEEEGILPSVSGEQLSSTTRAKSSTGPGEEPTSVKHILDVIAARLHSNQQVRDLAECARAWKILKTGALARCRETIGKDLDLSTRTEMIVVAFEKRFISGRMSYQSLLPAAVPGHGSMLELIQNISHNTQVNPGTEEIRYEESMEGPPESLLREPATASQVTQLEARLGVHLPDDYKTFLLTSNGFGSAYDGIMMQPALFSVDEVCWITDDQEYFTTLQLELFDMVNYDLPNEFPQLWDEWPKTGQAIQIASEDIDEVWLLPPRNVKPVRDLYLRILDDEATSKNLKQALRNAIQSFAGSREAFEELGWCVVTWASGGCASMNAYASFTAFMAQKAMDSTK